MSRRTGQPLTEQQLRILSLISHGYSNAEVADQLFIAVNTVKSHLARALRAMKAVDSAHAVRIALEDGWLAESLVRRSRDGAIVARDVEAGPLDQVKDAARALVHLMHTEMAGDEMQVWAAVDRLAILVGAQTCAEFLGVED